MKSIYEQHVLKAYLIDNIKIVDASKVFNEGVLKKDFLDKGLSLNKIAKKHRCSRGLIKKNLVIEGVSNFSYRPEKIKASQFVVDEIRKMKKTGPSYQSIAYHLNSKRVPTRTESGLWHAKTVREVYLT